MTDMKNDENALSDYETALSLLKHNPPEHFLKLEKCWAKIRLAQNISEDQKYPSLAYNSAVGRRILNGAEEYLSRHGADARLLQSIVNFGSTTTEGRYGGYTKSKKQADGTIKYKRSGAEAKVMIVIEVGYCENYTAFCRDKDLWIEGQHVPVCILVCLDESPRFRNSKARYEHVSNVDVEMQSMARCVAESVDRDSTQSNYGEIKYPGHTWVGGLTNAFIEVWRANKKRY
ncbi:hypothetical protein V1517DRAFT_348230 [Lipomyces orientalis]|uniref:Uncharacterized protein n=1 Tax=Lipomyces orientalis TaxID=1233043 RepID=A0ACC3TGW1_9ASCO